MDYEPPLYISIFLYQLFNNTAVEQPFVEGLCYGQFGGYRLVGCFYKEGLFYGRVWNNPGLGQPLFILTSGLRISNPGRARTTMATFKNLFERSFVYI